MNITKRTARERLDVNDAGLAAFFNITPSAVSQWGDDEPLPTPRQWELMARKPDLFGSEQTNAA
jgi:DNA-binding transcriptional regulator YiaG